MKHALMKKLSSAAVALGLSLSLAACGASGGASGKGAAKTETVSANSDGTINNPEAVKIKEGDLSFWSLFTGGDGEWWKKIVDQYNQKESPKHPVQNVTLVWADYYTKLQTAVAAGKGPDMGVSHVSKLYELANSGVIQPLDPYLEKAGIDLKKYYSKNNLDSVTINDQIYAIPLDTHAEVLYYNVDLLKQAGISEDDVANVKSIDDFTTLLKKCKDSLGSDVTPLSLDANGDDPYRIWYAFYNQMGGTPFVSEDATKNTLDEKTAKDAMKAVKDLYDQGYIAAGIDDQAATFQSGKAAFLFGGTWLTGTFGETKGLNFNNKDFPQLFDNDSCWADSHTLILPTNTKRSEEETEEAVKFLFSASNDGGIIWAGSGQIPASSTANTSDEYKKMKGYNVVSELDKAVFAPKASHYYDGIKTDVQSALDGYWTGQADIDAAYENVSSAITNNLD